MNINQTTFVFFHVGENIELPAKMVESICIHNPKSCVIQVTDSMSPIIPGVNFSHITEVNRQFLMLSRTIAWADLGLNYPAIYLDTDMIINQSIDLQSALGDEDVAMCRRSYNRHAIFNTRQKGLEFPEYDGKTLDELYPWVGCCTITRNADVWAKLTKLYLELPEKFWRWYGDQEVLREFARLNPVVELPESIWAGLPEYGGSPLITHYKGNRKSLMLK